MKGNNLRIKLSDVGKMTDEELLAKIEEMRNSPPESPTLQERLVEFEKAYDMTTEVMRDKLKKDEIRETADICNWLILAKLVDRCRDS